MDIQGEGQFLLASHNRGGEVAALFYRHPEAGKDDLALLSFQETPVDEMWLKVPHFVRDVQAGVITLRRSDSLPRILNHQPDPELVKDLDATQKNFIVQVCSLALSDQIKAAIHVGKLLGPTGVPRQNVRVTKEYLKLTHLVILRAALELEERWQNRKEVKAELREAIKRIEAL